MAVMKEQVMQEAMDMSNIQAPLAMRMAEHLPGIAASIGFSSARGSNTIMRGGYMDYKYGGALGKKRQAISTFMRPGTQGLTNGANGVKGSRMANKFRVMDESGALSARNKANFVGGGKIAGGNGILGRRASRLASQGGSTGIAGGLLGAQPVQKGGFFRGARLNNVTARPRALSRFHSLSVFSQSGTYTPFGAAGFLGNTKIGRKVAASAGVSPTAGASAFGPGLLSFISAGRKTDLLERRAMGGSSRALAKLGTVDRSIASLATMNNKDLFKPKVIQGTTTGPTLKQANKLNWAQRGGMSPSEYMDFNKITKISYGDSVMASGKSNMVRQINAPYVNAGAMTGDVGVRGNLMASSMSGEATRYMAGYFRGAQGFAGKSGLEGKALAGAEKAVAHMSAALNQIGMHGPGLGASVLEKGVIKELGMKGTMQAFGTKSGAKVLGARAAAMAIPGLNVIATASLVYDLGKMAGEVVKSGINLAKDAGKSLQGDIYKPSFGMGYKDTEAAATSRSRGVMAIQNSRLNARSMLGSEGAMMAAHYG
jgi:hypothetical protein